MQPQSTADVGTPLAPLPPFTRVRKGCSPKKLPFARKMRANPTPAEAKLWNALYRGSAGFKFRRQAIVFGWIPDLYCPAAGLIVEVDGGIHEQRRAYDAHRTAVLRRRGLHVIRFTNEEVLADVDAVCKKIGDILRAGNLPKPTGRVARRQEYDELMAQAAEERWPLDSPFGRNW